VLATSGLAPLVATIVPGDEAVRGKPDPESYRTAPSRPGLHSLAASVIAFEDTEAIVPTLEPSVLERLLDR
jgi:beta-phosphoglucomutase-like phosphatase (HAD superfamily)